MHVKINTGEYSGTVITAMTGYLKRYLLGLQMSVVITRQKQTLAVAYLFVKIDTVFLLWNSMVPGSILQTDKCFETHQRCSLVNHSAESVPLQDSISIYETALYSKGDPNHVHYNINQPHKNRNGKCKYFGIPRY